MTLDASLRALNEPSLTELRQAWQERRLTVVVGAGASAQSGLPVWNQLLERMLALWVEQKYKDSLVKGLTEEIVQHIRLQLQGESPIVVAQYIQAHVSDAEFAELVHRALYWGISEKPNPGPILKSIGRLGPRLRSIVTFNFDDLTETALRREGTENTPVAEAADLLHVRGLPVYHPHGYLPFEKDPKKSDSVVIAESAYHELYASPHSWSNIVFSSALLESACLFVSTSITDPNVRRVLGAVHRQMPTRRHFYIWSTPMKSYGMEGVLNDIFTEVFRRSQQSLGLEPVWFYMRNGAQSHADIPDILDAIRET